MVTDLSSLMTAENTLALGNKAKCMVKEYLLGQMEECMTVDTSVIKNKEWVSILGQTVNSTKDSGSTDSNMVKEHLLMYKA